MITLAARRPVLIVSVIRADTPQAQELVALLMALALFLWNSRGVWLELGQNINRLFLGVEAVLDTCQSCWVWWESLWQIPLVIGVG